MTSPTVPTTTDTTTTNTATGITDTDAGPLCPVCPHPLAAHDRIGLRYCAATAAQVAGGGQTNPGCSCG